MRTGSLRTLVTFEQRSVTRDPESNEEIVAWATFAQAWASIEAKAAPEFFDGTQRHAQTVFHCRFRADEVSGVNATMRMVVDGGDTLSIKGIMPDVSKRWHTLIHGVSGAGSD